MYKCDSLEDSDEALTPKVYSPEKNNLVTPEKINIGHTEDFTQINEYDEEDDDETEEEIHIESPV